MHQRPGFFSTLTHTLASIRLTLAVFFVLAVSSVIGTLLPQGLTLEEMRSHFSQGFFWWIETFSLHDLYHATWFQFLLLLLSINLVVCSVDRLPKTIKLITHREDQINADKLTKFSQNRELFINLPLEVAVSRVSDLISRDFSKLRILGTGTSFSAVAEKRRWSRLMVYVVHASVLMILSGALLGSLYGFKGFMQLQEGNTSNEVQLVKSAHVLELPFDVRCNDFEISFYDTGMPREFRSDLSILRNGQEAFKQSVLVNDPLTYEGVTFYQSSYGTILKEIELELKDRDSDHVRKMTLPFRETRVIPDTDDKVQVVEYQKDFSNFGPAAGIVLLKKGQQPVGSWILIDRPDFHGNRIQNYHIKVLRCESAFYTGLQVKRDPGVWVVYAGFTVMLVGIGLCFYTSHQKLWILADPVKTGGTRIIIAGRTSKNGLAFEQEFQSLCARLADALAAKSIGKQKGGTSHG